jgi:peptidoglycan/xylan/chitin deacetylase (PgdA/CDA1 family)
MCRARTGWRALFGRPAKHHSVYDRLLCVPPVDPRHQRDPNSKTMDKGTFIFSLDCEGYWGMGDVVSVPPREGWTSHQLAQIYRRLVELFDRYGIPGTWAFVAAFVHTEEEARESGYLLDQPIPYNGRDWAATFKACFGRGQTDGWLCPDALELVRASGAHEIAAHGFSHLPLNEAHTSSEVADRELDLLDDFWRRRGIRTRTFVYPRNQPGHLARLGRQFDAYRPPHPLEVCRDPLARLKRLVAELDLWVQPVEHGGAGMPAPLPPALLLNHRAGGRRLVPPSVTLARVRRMLRRAIESGKVVHLYSHPHNFITGHGQFELLSSVLAQVAEHVRRGELEVMTQAEYGRGLLARAAAPLGSAHG